MAYGSTRPAPIIEKTMGSTRPAPPVADVGYQGKPAMFMGPNGQMFATQEEATAAGNKAGASASNAANVSAQNTISSANAEKARKEEVLGIPKAPVIQGTPIVQPAQKAVAEKPTAITGTPISRGDQVRASMQSGAAAEGEAKAKAGTTTPKVEPITEAPAGSEAEALQTREDIRVQGTEKAIEDTATLLDKKDDPNQPDPTVEETDTVIADLNTQVGDLEAEIARLNNAGLSDDANKKINAMSNMINARNQAERMRLGQQIAERGLGDQGIANALSLNLSRTQAQGLNSAVTDIMIKDLEQTRIDQDTAKADALAIFNTIDDPDAQIAFATSMAEQFPDSVFGRIADSPSLQKALIDANNPTVVERKLKANQDQNAVIDGISDLDDIDQLNANEGTWTDIERTKYSEGELTDIATNWGSREDITLDDINANLPASLQKGSKEEFTDVELEEAYLSSMYKKKVAAIKEERIGNQILDITNTLLGSGKDEDDIMKSLIKIYGTDKFLDVVEKGGYGGLFDGPESEFLLYDADGIAYTGEDGINPYNARTNVDKTMEQAWGYYLDNGGNPDIGYTAFAEQMGPRVRDALYGDDTTVMSKEDIGKTQMKQYVDEVIGVNPGGDVVDATEAEATNEEMARTELETSFPGLTEEQYNALNNTESFNALGKEYIKDLANNPDAVSELLKNNVLPSFDGIDTVGYGPASRFEGDTGGDLQSAIDNGTFDPAIPGSYPKYVVMTSEDGIPTVYEMIASNEPYSYKGKKKFDFGNELYVGGKDFRGSFTFKNANGQILKDDDGSVIKLGV